VDPHCVVHGGVVPCGDGDECVSIVGDHVGEQCVFWAPRVVDRPAAIQRDQTGVSVGRGNSSSLVWCGVQKAGDHHRDLWIDGVPGGIHPARDSADASAEGVQRDLLPLIEGCTINTKHGNVETDHILFIASGAFHSVKPSDLLAELQGRLPIRVNLKPLTQGDFYRILTEPENNLIKQQQLLMRTEGVEVEFADEAIRELARVAFDVNSTVENIGARRLHTIIERVMEEVSFTASTKAGTAFSVDREYVLNRVQEMLKAQDLKQYLL